MNFWNLSSCLYTSPITLSPGSTEVKVLSHLCHDVAVAAVLLFESIILYCHQASGECHSMVITCIDYRVPGSGVTSTYLYRELHGQFIGTPCTSKWIQANVMVAIIQI